MLSDLLRRTIEERRAIHREHKLTTPWVERPVSLRTFLSGGVFIDHPPLSDIQFEAVDKIARFVTGEGKIALEQPNVAVLLWGKGSGKDTVSGLIMCRILYVLGCLADPHALFGQPRTSSIDLLNVAVTALQASSVFFDPMKRMIENSEWFMERLEVVTQSSEINVPPRIGHDKKRGDLFSVNCWSGHSEQEGMEGKNLLIAVLDEIDAFKSDVEVGHKKARRQTITADSMFEALLTSAESRYPEAFKVVMMSWPRYQGSFIMEAAARYRNQLRAYVSGPHPTWDVHPKRSFHDFRRAFQDNPELAWAKYGCRPPMMTEGYFRFTQPVYDAFHAEEEELEQGVTRVRRNKKDPGPDPPVTYNDRGQIIIADWFRPKSRRTEHFWHIDLAQVGDRAGVAMAHHEGWELNEEGDYEPVIVLDLHFYFEAPPDGEIVFSDIRAFILQLARLGFRTVLVTYDGWQSVDSRQILARFDQFGRPVRNEERQTPIEAGYLSVDSGTKVYDTLKAVIYGHRLKTYFQHLVVKELLQLMKIKAKKIDHPTNGSKDVSDAAAGAVYNAVEHAPAPPIRRGVTAAFITGGRKKLV